MTYARDIRPRLRAWTAAILTALLVAGGLTLGAGAASAAPGDVSSATLDWGIKASFRSYITGPIASGSWTLDGGVTDTTPFGWSGGSGSADVTGATGSVSYPGSVHFVGHGGVLDILFANVEIVQSSASAATLYVDTATATDVPLATLDLASATSTSGAGTVGFAGVPATLTADGATAFGGFYTEGTALDPVSFSWPVEQAAPATSTATALGVSPTATSVAGATVVLTATVSPAADGSVQFFDGATPVGASVAVVAGQATYSDTAFALGAHSFSAVFTPTDAAAFTASTATAVAHTVTAAPGNPGNPPSTVVPGNVTGGSAAWGLSTYLNSANLGRPNPLASAYVAPATFDAVNRITGWGSAIGTVNADGSADLAFDGTSVNFAPTGGGWLRLSGLEAHLDASGNGTVSAVVAYGTAPGAYPNITYSAALSPDRGPQRVTLVTLTGNTAGAVRDATSASWSALAGTWSSDFTSFLAGVSGSIPAWSYAPTVSSATDRTPRTFAFSVEVPPYVAPTSYDTGSAVWGLSTYLNSANPGRPNPLASAFVAPAAFDAITRLTTWGGGSGTVNADGSATVSYTGTSVNFAPTGGGWLKLSDLQATLDASGNGSVSAIASYGTAPGTYPNIVFNPAQVPDNGPTRVTLVTLSGNTAGVTRGTGTASWAGLAGTWSADFTAFLAGGGGSAAWSYAPTVSSAAGRTPLAFSFALGTAPAPAVATSVSLAASPAATVVLGTASTLTATVSPAAAGRVEFRNGSTVLGSAAVASGVAAFSASSLPVGSYSISAYFTPTDAAAFAPSQSAALAYSVTAPVVSQAGSLLWGVKASLQSYVLGGGSISTSGGAGAQGSSFLFPQESSAGFDLSSGTGTSAYRGQVTFAYPAHGFSISLSNPRVRADSATAGSLIVDVTYNGTTTSGVNFATLFLGAATKSSSAGSTTFTNAPAALTTAGAAAFQGFYAAGDSLDPVTFVVGAPAESFAATSVAAPAPRTAAATPPATTGITVTAGKPVAGGQITIVADGFQPNEDGILVVVYSEPTVIDANGKADANGRLTWTGRLPAELTGKHTLTFQGSVNRGVEVEIAARVTTAAAGCPVDGATLTWGFKESFRSYISGSIANGEWTVADGATYATPEFGWSAGKGAYDAKGGLVDFAGSVNFTGHGGILNTTVANPQLRFVDADTAILLLDVSGTTQDGAAVDKQDVEFVRVDLAGALVNADGAVTVTDAPTVLTPAGAAAFGTYEAGEPFDAVSFALPLDSACAAPAVEPSETATVTAEPASSATDLTWLWIVIAVVLLLIVAAVIVIVVRRRRTA